jgi:hypothetical protein
MLRDVRPQSAPAPHDTRMDFRMDGQKGLPIQTILFWIICNTSSTFLIILLLRTG